MNSGGVNSSQQCILWCILLSIISYHSCLPVRELQNSSAPINSDGKEKKGTIRIAGPWHSDSALDRNVDAGEDSYVKKIISSNEGINFNKDIAEAGEMFDVNGIEDFYDKNAMITYEINGHEIPVHMHPKLTPQSKSLFPEYLKDSPASMGLAGRGGNKHPGVSRSPISANPKKVPSNDMSMFAGATLNEMPEYKTESPIQTKVYSRRKKIANNILSGENSSGGNTLTKSPVENSVLNTNTKKQSLSTIDEFRQQRQPEQILGENTREYRNPIPLEFLQNGAEQEGDRMRESPPQVNDDIHNNFIEQQIISENTPHNGIKSAQQRGSDAGLVRIEENRVEKAEDSLREKPSSEESGETFEAAGANFISNKHYGANDNHVSSGKRNSEDVLFEKLESLHHNLEKDKLVNEADMKSVSDDKDDPNKAKAKERILNLLGALTDKLKGMEAIVSGNRDKKVEKFVSDNRETQIISGVKQVNELPGHTDHEVNKLDGESELNEGEIQRESVMYSDPPSEESEDLAKKQSALLTPQVKQELSGEQQQTGEDNQAEVRNSHQYEKEDFHANGEENAKELQQDEDGGKDMLMKTFGKISEYPDEALPMARHNTAEQNKYQSELIQRFRDDDKPFVMDTNAVDYKSNRNSDDSKDSDEGANFHNDHAGGEEETYDEEADSRQKLSHYRNRHRHTSKHFADDSKINDDEDAENANDEIKRRHREHKKRRHSHRYHDEIKDDESSTLKHHKRRHHSSDIEDDNLDANGNEDESVKGSSRKNFKSHDHSLPQNMIRDDEDLDGEENAKMKVVEESLAAADEKREKTDRPEGKDDAEFPDYNDVKDAAIFETNLLRKRFHAKPIHWSDKLSDQAQSQAERLAKLIDLNEKTLSAYRVPGEDVALVNINSTNVGKEAPDLWERGSKFYDFRSPQITNKNSDFAQMMWKAGNEFGLGVAKTKLANNWIVTSMFDTPVVDRFKDLKMNLESDIPIEDPYSDIVG